MQAYLSDKKERAVDYERLQYAWNRLAPFFGDMTPEQITRTACREYIKTRNVSPGTINKELRTLRAGLRHNDKLTPAIVELLPEPPPRERALTREEFSKLLHAAQGTHHLTVFLHLAIATAGRKEALLDLRWSKDSVGPGYVDFDAGQIYLGVKHNGKNRARVPMTNTLREVLKEAHEVRTSDYVIGWAGEPIKDIKNAFNKAVKRAGIEHATIHDIRHTSAVWMAGAGVSLEKISEYLGHTDINVTKRVYARYRPDHLKDAADALEL